MTYVYERMMEQIVSDRHQSLAELYDRSQRPGIMASGLGSVLIRIGTWLRHDLEVPGMPAVTRPEIGTGGC